MSSSLDYWIFDNLNLLSETLIGGFQNQLQDGCTYNMIFIRLGLHELMVQWVLWVMPLWILLLNSTVTKHKKVLAKNSCRCLHAFIYILAIKYHTVSCINFPPLRRLLEPWLMRKVTLDCCLLLSFMSFLSELVKFGWICAKFWHVILLRQLRLLYFVLLKKKQKKCFTCRNST